MNTTAMAAIDAVEIKCTIRPDHELRAERAMQVDEDTADVRLVYFYDTPDLDLFKAGVVLRARLVKGDADDSTVKFRPVEPASIARDWQRWKGFKLEADWVGDHVVCSASLTDLQKRDEIDEVAKGKRAVGKLFTSDQERFLREFHKSLLGFGKLRVMGPIRVLRWKPKHETFPHELTLEEVETSQRRRTGRGLDQSAAERSASGPKGVRDASEGTGSRPERRAGHEDPHRSGILRQYP